LERVTAHHSLGEIVVVGDRLYTDRTMRTTWDAILSVSERPRLRVNKIDRLSEDEFPSLIVNDLGDLLT